MPKDLDAPLLETVYDALWSRGRSALDNDQLVPEPLPSTGTTRWGISAVFRPWSSSIADCATTCSALVGPQGVVYGEHNLHVTLRSFEGWRGNVAEDDEALRLYREAVTSIVRDWPAIRIRFRGLTASASGILLQGWPVDDVQALRTALHDRLVASGSTMGGPEAERVDLRRTVHATLAMYGSTVARPAALSAFIERHRDTDFGEHSFETLSLVGYGRTVSDVRLTDYGRFAFGGVR